MALKNDTLTNKICYLSISVSKTINQNDENKDFKLILAPFEPLPKIDFGQAKINDIIERNLSIENPQKFPVELTVYMSCSKSNEIAHLNVAPGSSTKINIKWQPEKADKYVYTINFEVVNVARLKFPVNAVGVCVPDSVPTRKTTRMLRPLNSNEVEKQNQNQKVPLNVTRVVTSKKEKETEKENVANEISISGSTKQQQNIVKPPVVNKPIATTSSNRLTAPSATVTRKRSISRDGPQFTAERAKIRMEKSAANRIDVPKPVHTNYLKRNSNKTSSNYKTVQATKSNDDCKLQPVNTVNNNDACKLQPVPADNNKKIVSNRTYNKPNIVTPEFKANLVPNSDCDSCDNKWLEKEDSYNEDFDGLITSTQKTSLASKPFFGKTLFLGADNTPMIDYKSDQSQNSAKSTSSLKDLYTPIKSEKISNSSVKVEANENFNSSVYYHEVSYDSFGKQTFIKYEALENFL